jgi:hypothetical protein
MANNYCEFSALLEIPKDKLEKLEDLLEKIISQIVSEEEYLECEAEIDSSGIWFHSIDGSGQPEHVERIARYVIQNLGIYKQFICSYAYYCSKLRLDEFGGGAFLIEINKPTIWIEPVIEARKKASRRNKRQSKKYE